LNTYEVLIIFKPILDVENVDAIMNHFQKNIVEANQGEVVEMDRIGRKRLAYEIRKFKDGFLTLFLLKFPPAKVADFKRACQLNDDVLRITLVRQDSLPSRDTTQQEIAVGAGRDGGRDGGFHQRRDFRGGPPRRDFNRNDGDRPPFRGGDRDQQRPPREPFRENREQAPVQAQAPVQPQAPAPAQD
jgi:small subunit ribosomal protein S6